MAGSWVIRWTTTAGVKLYYRREKKKTLLYDGSRWRAVRTPVEAKRFFRKEQAELAAFTIIAAKPDLLGKLVVVQWDGNAKTKP